MENKHITMENKNIIYLVKLLIKQTNNFKKIK